MPQGDSPWKERESDLGGGAFHFFDAVKRVDLGFLYEF